MLSRLLSGAAAATAASLVGNTDRAFSEAHDVAGDGEDGSFDGFLQALQNGSLAAALRNGGSEMGGGSESTATDGGFAPVNFFRMFRFGSTGDNRGRSGESPENASDPSQNPDGGRLVPVIIVGIRSVTPTDSTGRDDGFITPPLFDAFSALPLGLPNGMPRGGSGTFMRRTDRAARFGRSRRASMGSVGSFPSNYDSQRHHRTGPLSSRSSPQSRPFFGSTLPTVLSDSPPGPHPPPSTPAEHGISAFSTGNNTPTRRPSSASVGSPMLTSSTQSTWREGSDARHASAGSPSVVEQPVTPTANPRRRRLSDSEFARYRDFGPGSSRRNGIVGDSDVGGGAARPHGGAQSEGTRSWIIYVLGGSYPEDHPILTTPSLFTDSPTYEDMLLLSSLLGPVKPPVATQEDVASAPGVYRVAGNANEPFAADISGERIELVPEGRCLVCLCDYELEEEVRRLNKCGHLYHRECIDTWLTTGRNSCPLCRSQGVGSEMSDAADTNEQPPTSTNPTIR
ncbi:MAG: hypothetical protein M1833_004042 [Piccolia ochrophora]|nr:MAG: hypothetical protein M1833_004042 [Piccolia ochrophora]